MNRIKTKLAEVMALSMLACPYGREDVRSYSPTPCKSVDNIPGYHHDGIYSQPKKLKKGTGHKKLTRAQRKKRNYYETKRR